MRIGVNLLFLVPGEVGGSEPLLTNLVEAMAGAGADLTVFAVKGFSGAYPRIASSTRVIEVPWATGAQARRIASEHTWLPRQLRKRKIDIVHHGVGTTPFLKFRPTAVTVHDIQYRHYPENFVKPKRIWLSVNVAQTVRRSEAVCVPSNWVAGDLVDRLSADRTRIHVVPFGSEELFGPDPASEEEVRKRYRLDRDFFYFPGRTYPHKNHRFLLEAFREFSSRADLVFTGAPWFRDRQIEAAARQMGLTGSVRYLGMVPRRELSGLYKGAVALVYPTWFEGFGAPVLEAMASRCPVVASNVTAIPEVVGDAGILLEPSDLQGWAESMERLLNSSESRETLISLGEKRAKEFSWKRSADLQLDAYRKALG